jgi:hypothetical protein
LRSSRCPARGSRSRNATASEGSGIAPATMAGSNCVATNRAGQGSASTE